MFFRKFCLGNILDEEIDWGKFKFVFKIEFNMLMGVNLIKECCL